MSPGRDSVRITVYLDQPVEFSYRETTAPAALILEIPRAGSRVPAGVIPIGRHPVQQLKVSPSNGSDPARLEVTFSTPAKSRVTAANNGRRITIEASADGSVAAVPPTAASSDHTTKTVELTAVGTQGGSDPETPPPAKSPKTNTHVAAAGDVLECSFKDTDIHDVIQTIAKLVGANIVADGSVQGKITLSLTNIGWEEGLGTALRSLGYSLQKDGSVYSVTKSAPEAEPIVTVDVGRLSVSANQVDVKKLLAVIAQKSGLNIVASSGVDGKVSVQLVGVPVEDGLYTFLSANGYSFRKLQDIYVVDKAEAGKTKPPVRPYKQVAAAKITIDFKDMRK